MIVEEKAAPVTRKMLRDAHIRERYRALRYVGDQGQRAQAVYEEGYEGEPYMIAVETLLRIAKSKG